MPDDKKGITVKIDAALHTEVRQYVESHNMTMAEFVAIALGNELHPKIQMKEEKNMGNMRTLAIQIPEDLFQRLDEYLKRNNMTKRSFLISLITEELDREMEQDERQEASESEDEMEAEDGPDEDSSPDEDTSDITDDAPDIDEDESVGMTMEL